MSVSYEEIIDGECVEIVTTTAVDTFDICTEADKSIRQAFAKIKQLMHCVGSEITTEVEKINANKEIAGLRKHIKEMQELCNDEVFVDMHVPLRSHVNPCCAKSPACDCNCC